MRAYLGEDGTEQFTVTTRVDGELIKEQPIHDPFIHTTTMLGLTRWQALKQLLRPKHIKITVHVTGTQAIQRRIMTFDPFELQEEESAIHATNMSRHALPCDCAATQATLG